VKYLLDTNICIYIIKRQPAAAIERIRSTRPEDIGISTITLAELEYGAAKSLDPGRKGSLSCSSLFRSPFLTSTRPLRPSMAPSEPRLS